MTLRYQVVVTQESITEHHNIIYYRHGLRHRINYPALIFYDKDAKKGCFKIHNYGMMIDAWVHYKYKER